MMNHTCMYDQWSESSFVVFIAMTWRNNLQWNFSQNENPSFMNMHLKRRPQNVDHMFWPQFVKSREGVPLH